MGRCVGAGVRVVGLPCPLSAVGSRDSSASGVGSSVWIVGIAYSGGPVWTVCGCAGAIGTTVPCAISVVNIASIYDRAAVPIAIPAAVTPSATVVIIVYRCTYSDAHPKRY
jgi:hypothetical protein